MTAGIKPHVYYTQRNQTARYYETLNWTIRSVGLISKMLLVAAERPLWWISQFAFPTGSGSPCVRRGGVWIHLAGGGGCADRETRAWLGLQERYCEERWNSGCWNKRAGGTAGINSSVVLGPS